jgi:hypothetical protein
MPDCKSCKENRQNVEPVPYIVHESAMARQERNNKRLWVVVIILIAALILTNAAWIYYESQWEVVETTTQEVEQTTDGDGDNNFVGGDYYGSAESENDQN